MQTEFNRDRSPTQDDDDNMPFFFIARADARAPRRGYNQTLTKRADDEGVRKHFNPIAPNHETTDNRLFRRCRIFT
jgi:hypothetical protein